MYQTDGKKYECRTGPFEGFFVSSVESCKHINLTKIMREKLIEQEHKVRQGPTGSQENLGI